MTDDARTDTGTGEAAVRLRSPPVHPRGGHGPAGMPSPKPRELTSEELRDAVKRVGRPWGNRKKVVPRRMIKAYRRAGFSLRQIGKLYGLSATSIKRRLRGE